MPAPRAEVAAGLAARLIVLWALGGGALLLALVGLNLWSVLADALVGKPFPGTIELTELGTAVAVAAFFPYCQLTRANVQVDVFTARAGPRALHALDAVAAAGAFVVALVIAWRMALGLADQRASGLGTAILQLPVWLAFVPIVASFLLLALAALVSVLVPPAEAPAPE